MFGSLPEDGVGQPTKVSPRLSRWLVLISVPLLLMSLLTLSMQNWSIAQAAGSVVVGPCDNSDYATIQEAVNNASPDTVIDICPGTYSESVNLSLMGSTAGAM